MSKINEILQELLEVHAERRKTLAELCSLHHELIEVLDQRSNTQGQMICILTRSIDSLQSLQRIYEKHRSCQGSVGRDHSCCTR